MREGSDFTLLAFGVAGWMRYVGGVDEQKSRPIDISDPLAQRVAQTPDNDEWVWALLSLQTVSGDDFPADARFVKQVNRYYQQLQTVAALMATLN